MVDALLAIGVMAKVSGDVLVLFYANVTVALVSGVFYAL